MTEESELDTFYFTIDVAIPDKSKEEAKKYLDELCKMMFGNGYYKIHTQDDRL